MAKLTLEELNELTPEQEAAATKLAARAALFRIRNAATIEFAVVRFDMIGATTSASVSTHAASLERHQRVETSTRRAAPERGRWRRRDGRG